MRRLTLIALLLVNTRVALSQETPQGWRLFGTNEFLLEDFSVSGDTSATPFPFEGTFFTDRLGLNLGWSDDARNLLIRAEILGTDSDYLPEDGFVVATLSLSFENGAAAVPYRVQAGDLFADMSRRVLQRQIRGSMLELQPNLGSGSHSLILLLGSGVPDWADTFGDAEDLSYAGASWLWQSPSQTTTLVANVMTESAKAGAEGVFPVPAASLDHLVTSFSARTTFAGLNFEGEVSLLDSDSDADEATSFYAELARQSVRVHWRARYEDNAREYLPFGAMGIIAGRSTVDAQGRWIVNTRTSLRGRLQHIDSRAMDLNPGSSMDLAGMSWESRPLAARPGFLIQLMADANRIETDDRSQDVLFQNYGVEVQDWVTDTYDLTYRGWLRDLSDDIRADTDRQTFDHELLLGRVVKFSRWSGRIGGGVAYRQQSGSGPFESFSPLAEMNLRTGPHQIRLHYGLVDQRYTAPGASDIDYHNRRAMYSFAAGSHEVSLEYGQELREPELLLETDSSRLALRYRYAFAREF